MRDLNCVEGTCFDGSQNDPCVTDVDCSPSYNQCLAGQCLDGEVFTFCVEDEDCDSLVCWDGICFGFP